MAVYVDRARNPYGRMIMCHMVADTIPELLEMADAIGLARRHFQPTSHPHFDISLGYKARAIAKGAREIGMRDLVAVMKRQRERLRTDAAEAAAYAAATEASDKGRRMVRTNAGGALATCVHRGKRKGARLAGLSK